MTYETSWEGERKEKSKNLKMMWQEPAGESELDIGWQGADGSLAEWRGVALREGDEVVYRARLKEKRKEKREKSDTMRVIN